MNRPVPLVLGTTGGIVIDFAGHLGIRGGGVAVMKWNSHSNQEEALHSQMNMLHCIA